VKNCVAWGFFWVVWGWFFGLFELRSVGREMLFERDGLLVLGVTDTDLIDIFVEFA
jgi:hypothetical protein